MKCHRQKQINNIYIRSITEIKKNIKMIEKKILKNRNEWVNSRVRLGGSDAAAVLGLNPYKSNTDLWLEKKGKVKSEDISDKDCVKYGIAAEEYLRELFKLDYPKYEVIYDENNIFFNTKYPFAHASLDGELVEKDTGRKGILEIKTTNILQSMQKENWKGKIPENYYVQVIHYLMVTEYDFAVLKAQLKSVFNDEVYIQVRHYFIEREDVANDIEYLKNKERKFWESLKMANPPNLILPDI